MKKISLLFFVFITLTLLSVSCDKKTDNVNTTNFDQQSALAQNYAFIQDVYGDIFDLICQASGDSVLMATTQSSIDGASVTYDSITNKFVFTFPTKSTNGKTGEFTADLNGDFQEVGTVAHISFNNYSVNGNLIQGSNDITNKNKISGKKTTGFIISYTDSVNAQIVKGGETINVNALYNVDWELGSIFTTDDDQYWFSGSVTGSVNPNKSFTATVLNNSSNKILVTPTCQYIQSGIITAEMHTMDSSNNPKLTTVIIDFGKGCNNLVQITMDDGTILTFPM